MMGSIGKYEGATTGTRPLWDFHDEGKSLCVYGVILTHITSHFRPLEGARGLASILRDGLSGMSQTDKMRAQKSLSRFLPVSTGDWSLQHELGSWWRMLSTRTVYNREREWIEDLMVTDKHLRASNLVNGILRDERLSVVCCEANARCPGGPAFAAIGAQEGDTVALVSGVSFPLVLRPNERLRFRLIGPLFLPGVMDGELRGVLTPDSLHEIVLV